MENDKISHCRADRLGLELSWTSIAGVPEGCLESLGLIELSYTIMLQNLKWFFNVEHTIMAAIAAKKVYLWWTWWRLCLWKPVIRCGSFNDCTSVCESIRFPSRLLPRYTGVGSELAVCYIINPPSPPPQLRSELFYLHHIFNFEFSQSHCFSQ